MKPKQAAAIFEDMTDNLDLAARILSVMDAADRGKILGAMDPVVAAQLTKIMDRSLKEVTPFDRYIHCTLKK